MPHLGRQTTVYELGLLENGLDFVKSGIEIYFGRSNPRSRAHKYAILHVFSGVLLLLKERLARIRPSLLFVCEADVGKPGAKTTDYHETFRRLEEHGVHIDPMRRAVLDEIRVLRNAIEHYRVDLPLARSKEVIGEMVSFAYIFCRDELNVYLDDSLAQKAREGFYDLKEVGERIERDIAESAIADAEADERYFREFEQRYATMSPDELLRHAAAARAIAVEDVSLVRCSSCDEKTLVLLEAGACANPDCRATFQLATCRACYEVTFKGEYFCDSCRYG